MAEIIFASSQSSVAAAHAPLDYDNHWRLLTVVVNEGLEAASAILSSLFATFPPA